MEIDKRLRIARPRFPGVCVLCGGSTSLGLICSACYADLPFVTTACQQCARPLPSNEICGRCLKHRPPYTRTVCVFDYRFPVNKMVKDLKYGGKSNLASQLGTIMSDYFIDHVKTPLPECLIPVPLHRWRLIRRGFNQALELARPIADNFDLPIELGCKRIRNTPPQACLPTDMRRKNIRRAFSVPATLNSRHVAIVEDVITTGNTVSELAKTLLRAGVERVDVWACCRAFPLH